MDTKMSKKGRIVRLPILEDGSGAVEIGVNGTMYILMRGEDARVSDAVYEVLRNAGMMEENVHGAGREGSAG